MTAVKKIDKRFILSLILIFLFSLPAFPQVVNDNIQNRITLTLDDAPFRSSTDHSRVEWGCINKALTHKCLIYHNDQWFTIKPQVSGPLYLNVSNQRCRDQHGVQVVMLEGDPCKTDSYQLKKCIPFTDQADFFVTLDSLRIGEEYLINIDGFLGDRCEFDIAFSSDPAGLPIHPPVLKGTSFMGTRKDSLVELRWRVPDSRLSQLKEFTIARKTIRGKRSFMWNKPMVYNAYGAPQKDYTITDTLREKGEYLYNLYARWENGVFLLGSQKITYKDVYHAPVIRSNKRQVEYYLKHDGSVQILVQDASGKALFSTRRMSQRGRNVVTLDFTPYVEKGFSSFKVILRSKTFNDERNITINPAKG